jgi:hypothetical protein
MALGGWMSGLVFDHTGSYQAAFLKGVLWNVLHAWIVFMAGHAPGPPPGPA